MGLLKPQLKPQPIPIDVAGFTFQDRSIFKSRSLTVQYVPGYTDGLTNATTA